MADLLLGPDGDLTRQPQWVRGVPEVVQRIRVRLETYQGEVPAKPTFGIPYLRWLGKKRPDLGEIRNVLVREVLAVKGVLRVERAEVSRAGQVVQVELQIVTPEEGAIRIRVDLFGNGAGVTGGQGWTLKATTPVNAPPVIVVLLGVGAL